MEYVIMNERLRFSWGHIIAFIALIIVSYLSFVGYTYLSGGNFLFGVCAMGITDVVFILVFIGAQQLKASSEKMSRKIIWERILVFGSPLIFAVGMIGISHVWTVRNHNDEVVALFDVALEKGNEIFDEYEVYANARIGLYDKNLTQILRNKNSNSAMYRQAGFDGKMDNVKKENMLEVLRLKLLSPDYESLKLLASEWMEKARQGASTYNVFLLGNTQEIKEALNDWTSQLKNMSASPLSNEDLLEPVVAFDTQSSRDAGIELDAVNKIFTEQKFPTLGAIGFGLLLYLMLILPYFIQERHSKSVYKLRVKEKDKEDQEMEENSEVMPKRRQSPRETFPSDEDFPTF